MQSLLGGADCSTSSNPLKQVLQREGVDNSLFRDRLASPNPSQLTRPSAPIPFFATHHHPPLHAQPAAPFNLSHLSAALGGTARLAPSPSTSYEAEWNRVRRAHTPPGHSPGPQAYASRPPHQVQAQSSFISDFAQWQSNDAPHQSDWAASYDGTGKGKGRAVPPPPPVVSSMALYQPRNHVPFQSSLSPMYRGQTYQPQFAHMPGANAIPDHAEMEAAFERALADSRIHEERGAQTGEQKVGTTAALEEETVDAKGDFEAVWESLRPEAERLGKLAEWERDFSQFTNDDDDLFDVLNDSLNRDDVGQAGLDEQLTYDRSRGQAEVSEAEGGLPRQSDYEFNQPNAFDYLTPQACWAEANRLLSSGGSLSDAALMLESFLSRATEADYAEVRASGVEAWALLGHVHAMDEKEERAVAAYQRGQTAMEADGEMREKIAGELLTNLAISYVNESLDLAALTTLHRFLTLLHPTHAGPAPSRSATQEGTDPWAVHKEMTASFLALAQAQYAAGGAVNADVQVGLGTLYYMMGEYEEARDCWVAALGERPDDYLLWNRLGATLANGGNPEEAVDAYRRALELRPTFTRAIYNLGVACLNIGVHREAAEHFLAALSLHSNADGDGGYDSATLWHTLRRSFLALELPHLAERAVPGTDLEMFRQAGFEF